MSNEEELDYLIENEVENTRLDFKREIYHKDKKEELIKDVMAMANAHVEDAKYIIFGVKLLKEGSREFFPVQDIPDQSDIEEIIHNNIEPTIDISFYSYNFRGVQLAILEIEGYIDRPYVSKKDYRKIKSGEAVIRKGSTTSRLGRADYDKIYSYKSEKINQNKITIGFGEELKDKLELNIKEIRTEDLPSTEKKEFYEEKLKLLNNHLEDEKEKEQDQEEKSENTLSSAFDLQVKSIRNIAKLFQENEFLEGEITVGSDTMGRPIRLSREELEDRIANVNATYSDYDWYFIQENIAQELNLYLLNKDDKYLEDVFVKLFISSEIGYIFTENLQKPVNDPLRKLYSSQYHSMVEYPSVEQVENCYIITESIDTLRHHLKETLFVDPLKIVYSPNKSGTTFSLNYEIHAKNLTNPINGLLEIKLNS